MANSRRRSSSYDSDDEPEQTSKQVGLSVKVGEGDAKSQVKRLKTDDRPVREVSPETDDGVDEARSERMGEDDFEPPSGDDISEEAAMEAYTAARLRDKNRQGVSCPVNSS